MYAVSGVMQAILLVMCFIWKARQRRLGIDDFGHPLNPTALDAPAPMIRGADGGETVEDAVEEAIEEDVPGAGNGQAPDEESGRVPVGEETPLLKGGSAREEGKGKGWLSWLRR